jgi:hypothetical protein
MGVSAIAESGGKPERTEDLISLLPAEGLKP